jgi:hypothetical protein
MAMQSSLSSGDGTSGLMPIDKMKATIHGLNTASGKMMGARARWNIGKAALIAAGVGRFEEVHTKDVMCHPKNRSRSGLNFGNIHRVGASIKRTGADMDMLKPAAAFELSQESNMRKAQIQWNQNLVDRSQGLMAQLTGKEFLVLWHWTHSGLLPSSERGLHNS